jgi:metal-responsive CopG/Arc/MetJ family transcriptional regulator
MKAENLRKLFRNKTKLITLRINPELLSLFDETLKKDKQYVSRNEWFETLILRYLEEKGKL